ncbi:hypothetical protein HMPREF0293_2201 [Corynebacterium glucuronolyticum ATCC 51866]|uniref:Uncharacterized protein n=1 Tax=Corynebacterium glucuronolyticum ATCC 51866 TaxID=548478 RepID=A0ABM9XMI4_9CORY|nr:hypothetical protein HMPREF0293_2201 [Corynebacterium glucuronolyticum ATCC 51866]
MLHSFLILSLPVVAIAKTKAYINSYNIKGVWMKDPPKQWRIKRENAQKRFSTISPDELLQYNTQDCTHTHETQCAQPPDIQCAPPDDTHRARGADTLHQLRRQPVPTTPISHPLCTGRLRYPIHRFRSTRYKKPCTEHRHPSLKALPIYHRTEDSINAHITIVTAALVVAHEMAEYSGMSLKKLARTPRRYRSFELEVNGQTIHATVPYPTTSKPSSTTSSTHQGGTKMT